MSSFVRPISGVVRYCLEPRGAVFHTDCEQVAVRFVDGDIVRVTMESASGKSDAGPHSQAVIHPETVEIPIVVSEDGSCITMKAPGLSVRVGLCPLRIDFFSADGQPLCVEPSEGGLEWKGRGARCRKVIGYGQGFFGFGERTGFLNKRGTAMTMWNSDINPHLPSSGPLYISIPFFMAVSGGRGYGLFLDSPARTVFDMGHADPETYTFFAAEERLDYYFIAGPGIKDILTQYTRLTGRMALPPLWALGYHQSRYSYYPDTQVHEVARALREHEIPCDAICLDIDYMSGARVFTFDAEGFEHPAALAGELARMGFRLVAIVDAGVKVDPGYSAYDEGVKNGYFIRTPDGEPAVARVWPGDVHLPDFTRPQVRQWWAEQHRILFENGIDGIWNDMNEPAAFDTPSRTVPLETLHGGPGAWVRHEYVHNEYANRMAEATALAFEKFRPGERPFIISRAGYAGIQRHACTWTGDNSSWWEHLLMAMPMCLNLGLSGQPFVGTDVGGFLDDADPELVARWTQFAVFTPFFRNHNGKGFADQEPYALPEPYRSVCREAIRFRYRLLPYLYTLMREATVTGWPVMRPMMMEFQDDGETLNLFDQFMFGADVLVAPVYQPGARHRVVYFPKGRWYDFWTGDPVEDGRHAMIDAPLERIPMFVREGATLFFGPVMLHTGHKPGAVAQLDIYPVPGGRGSAGLYADDGSTLAYRSGHFGTCDFSWDFSTGTVLTVTARWNWPGQPNGLPLETVRVNGLNRRPDRVSLNGDEIPAHNSMPSGSIPGWHWDERSNRLTLGIYRSAPLQTAEILLP